MSDIPNDICEKAAAALAQFPDSRVKTNLGVIIARVLLAERHATEARVREECAKIADEIGAGDGSSWFARAGKDIAAAIREGRK